MKRMLAMALAVLLLLSLAACSAAEKATDGMYAEAPKYEGVYDSVQAGTAEDIKGEDAAPVDHAQKLIRTMTIEAETEDMDALMGVLDGKIRELGGYVESRNLRNGGKSSGKSYRYADLTIRIPAEKLDSFVEHIQGASNVTNHRESTDDVTLTYVATESRIRALETEQERLLELLGQAENMSDILLIDERLTNVLAELEEVTSLLRMYDNLVSYGTVHLSISEVVEYSLPEDEMTVWQRIGTGFTKNMKNLGNFLVELFVFLVVIIPLLIPVAVIGLGIFLFIRLYDRRRAKQKEARSPDKPKES